MAKQKGSVNIIVIAIILMAIVGVSYFVFVRVPNNPASQKELEAATNNAPKESPSNVKNTPAEPRAASSSNTEFTLVSPNGGEALVRGSEYTVKWKNPKNIGPIDIFLVKDGKIQIDIGFAPGAGATAPTSFIWKKVDPTAVDITTRTVHPLPDGGDYKIRISDQDGNIFDESDAVFSIVSQ